MTTSFIGHQTKHKEQCGDDNCNGGIDDGLTFANYYPDTDGDGFGAAGAGYASGDSADAIRQAMIDDYKTECIISMQPIGGITAIQTEEGRYLFDISFQTIISR